MYAAPGQAPKPRASRLRLPAVARSERPCLGQSTPQWRGVRRNAAPHLGQHGQDGAQVCALRDELERHKVLREGGGVASGRSGQQKRALVGRSGRGVFVCAYALRGHAAEAPRHDSGAHVHDGIVVAVDEMADGLNHAILDAVINL